MNANEKETETMNHYRRGEKAARELLKDMSVETAAAVLCEAINGASWEEHRDATRGATDVMLRELTK